MYKHFFKRFFDFWIAFFVLICLSPLLLVVTLWLHFANKGTGAFFLQERPGKDGKIFRIVKFKTMTAPARRSAVDTSREDCPIDVAR